MSNPNKEKAPIVVQATIDTVKCMHPQNQQYKNAMLARAEAAQQRYRRQQNVKSAAVLTSEEGVIYVQPERCCNTPKS
ncbi:hypothetical protein KQ941_05885 [Paenibacillus xylanexedens]|uniref:hypothetical protein n=1 Tax=Paenibacillus xylanexedens TaxID=528191 RepID=UPI001F3680D4|nr:hypothetical protein [Paenibacillus xylanexedens]MCF7753971.1 hypothetical protein [Paenibacillus xylanexedens]